MGLPTLPGSGGQPRVSKVKRGLRGRPQCVRLRPRAPGGSPLRGGPFPRRCPTKLAGTSGWHEPRGRPAESETGLCLVWAPEADLVARLVGAAGKEDRDAVLVRNSDPILTSIERVVAEVVHPELRLLRESVIEAVHTARAGYFGASQALSAAILTSVLKEHYGFSFRLARRAFDTEPPAAADIWSHRRALVQRAIQLSILNSHKHSPDGGFNRHITGHGSDLNHLSEPHSLEALMLVGGTLRELQVVYRIAECAALLLRHGSSTTPPDAFSRLSLAYRQNHHSADICTPLGRRSALSTSYVVGRSFHLITQVVVATHSHARPNNLHDAEWPSSSQEAIGAGEQAAASERQEVTATARLQRVHRDHEGDGKRAKGGQHVEQSDQCLGRSPFGRLVKPDPELDVLRGVSAALDLKVGSSCKHHCCL